MLKHKNLLRKWSILTLLAMIVFLVTMALPAQAAQEISQVQGYVTVYQLNIRSGPDTSYGIVTVVYRGQTLALTGRTANSVWVRVNAGSYSGWAYTSYIYSETPIQNLPVVGDNQPGPTPFGYVGVPYLNLRSGPGLNYSIVAGLERNTELGLIGRNGDASWVQISWGPGSAWVYTRYIWTNYPINSLPITDGNQPGPRPAAWVGVYRLNFREGPGLNYPVVALLGRGTSVTLLGRNTDGSWVMVDLGNSQVAWAMRSFLHTRYPIMDLPLIMTAN